MRKHFTCILLIAMYPASIFAKDGGNNGHNLFGEGAFHFVENKGQVTDQYHHQRPDISFSLPAKGLSVFIGNGQLHYQFAKADKAETQSKGSSFKKLNTKEGAPAPTTVYRMDATLVGANTQAVATASQQQSYTEHYYLSQTDKSGTVAHSYDKITYAEIYPHIDWVIYIKDNKLEYDFVVKPEGNIADIKIKYDGTTALKISEQGSLVATTPMGNIEEQAPNSYQGTVDNKKGSRYVLQGNQLGFEVPHYNSNTTLTIDPTLAWQTFYGGAANGDASNAVATDAAGNVYIAGNTTSATNIATTGAYQTTINGGDAFLAQFNSAGVLQWGTYYGGMGTDVAKGVACDAAGNVYITGSTTSSTLIATTGAYQTTPGDTTNGGDAFVAKFDNTGALQWGTYYGGSRADAANAITCDAAGNTYITGSTLSSTGIATAGTQQTTIGDSVYGCVFVASFNNAGQLQWGTYYGGVSILQIAPYGAGISCDADGIYVTGATGSGTGIATSGAFQTSIIYPDPNVSDGVAFLSRYSNAGVLQWGTYYQGIAYYYGIGNTSYVDGSGYGVTCDQSGNVYMCGTGSNNTGWATPGAYQTANLTLNGPFFNITPGTFEVTNNAYVAKFNNSGQRIWGTYYGGYSFTLALGIAADAAGSVYITGTTFSDSGIATPGTYDSVFTGQGFSGSAFVAGFDSIGSMQWSTYYGSTSGYTGNGVACSSAGVYTTGNTGGGTGVDSLFLIELNNCTASLSQPGTISGPVTICPGSTNTYTVPAVSGATYYQWSLPSGWTSNSNFGTTTTNSITITADTTGTAADTELIAVTANNSCGSSIPQTLSLTLAANAVINPDTDIRICQGDTLTLSTNTGANYTYQWQFDNTDISGATNATCQPQQQGFYKVTVTNGACIAHAIPVSVFITPIPLANVSFSAPPIVCQGEYILLLANAGTNYTYQWQLDSVNIVGATNIVYQPVESGAYTVKVADVGCSATSLPFSVNINPTPQVAITPSTVAPFCQGDSAIITAIADTGNTYQWTLNGINTSTHVLQNAAAGTLYVADTAKAAGIYTIIATNIYGCIDSASDTIIVFPFSIPVITATGATLATGAYASYQWYNGAQAVNGATNESYTTTDTGSYYVVVSDSNGCSGQSAGYTFSLGVQNIDINQLAIQLYPDPNNGNFILNGRINNGDVAIEVINVTGQVFFNESVVVRNNVLHTKLNISELVPPGLYTVKIVSGDRSVVMPFIKK